MRQTKKPTHIRQSLNQQIYESKQKIKRLTQRQKVLQNEIQDIKQKIRWAFEVTISLLINYNQSFVSQYTILYKSYMILTAFVLTIVGNYLWVGWGGDVGGQQQYQQGQINRQEGFLSDRFHPQSLLYTITYILPLRGKFSLLFFQLMLLTTLQILYQSCIQIHYRYKSFIYHRNKSKQQQQAYQNQRAQYLKQIDLLSKYTKAKIQQQKHPEKYNQQLEQMASRVELKSSSSLLSSRDTVVPSVDNILTPLKFLLQNCKQINGWKLLCETKFLYLFALMYSQTVLWQGAVVYRWKQRFVHLFIIFCCIMEFVIWAMINLVLQVTQGLTFGDKGFVQLSGNGEIALGRY